MERIRGGRAGLHSELRRYIDYGCDGDIDDSRLLVDLNSPPVLPSRWMLKKLSKGHSPTPVGEAVSPKTIAARKSYQLMRARELHGSLDETPEWRRYHCKHLAEILVLN